MARTRSEAARRGVQRFLKDLAAGTDLGGFLAQLAERGDDFAKLTALEMAHDLPPERAFSIYRKALVGRGPAPEVPRAEGDRRDEGDRHVAPGPHPRPRRAEGRGRGDAGPGPRHPRAGTGRGPRHAPPRAGPLGGRGARRRRRRSRRSSGSSPWRRATTRARSSRSSPTATSRSARGRSRSSPGSRPTSSRPGSCRRSRGRSSGSATGRSRRSCRGNPGFVPALLKLAESADPALARPARGALPPHRRPPGGPRLAEARRRPRLVGPGPGAREHRAARPGRRGPAAGPRPPERPAHRRSPPSARSAPWATRGPPGPSSSSSRRRRGSPTTSSRSSTPSRCSAPKLPKVAEVLASVSKVADLDRSVRDKARRLVGKLQGDAARDALPPVIAVVDGGRDPGEPGADAPRLPRRHGGEGGVRLPPRDRFRPAPEDPRAARPDGDRRRRRPRRPRG